MPPRPGGGDAPAGAKISASHPTLAGDAAPPNPRSIILWICRGDPCVRTQPNTEYPEKPLGGAFIPFHPRPRLRIPDQILLQQAAMDDPNRSPAIPRAAPQPATASGSRSCPSPAAPAASPHHSFAHAAIDVPAPSSPCQAIPQQLACQHPEQHPSCRHQCHPHRLHAISLHIVHNINAENARTAISILSYRFIHQNRYSISPGAAPNSTASLHHTNPINPT